MESSGHVIRDMLYSRLETSRDTDISLSMRTVNEHRMWNYHLGELCCAARDVAICETEPLDNFIYNRFSLARTVQQ